MVQEQSALEALPAAWMLRSAGQSALGFGVCVGAGACLDACRWLPLVAADLCASYNIV